MELEQTCVDKPYLKIIIDDKCNITLILDYTNGGKFELKSKSIYATFSIWPNLRLTLNYYISLLFLFFCYGHNNYYIYLSTNKRKKKVIVLSVTQKFESHFMYIRITFSYYKEIRINLI